MPIKLKKYRDRSLRLLKKINPTKNGGVYHQSEPAVAGFFVIFTQALFTQDVLLANRKYVGAPRHDEQLNYGAPPRIAQACEDMTAHSDDHWHFALERHALFRHLYHA